MLNAVHLRTLVAVLEAGTLSGAAKTLGYTTSAVSQQIVALERSVGVPLFERGPRSLWPTAAGLTMGRHAEAVIARLAEAEEDMAGYARGGAGRLRIGSFPTVGASLLPRALARFVTAHPDTELTVTDHEDPMAVAADLDEGRLDLGVVFEYPHVPRSWPGDLVRRELLHEELVVLCGPAEAGEPASLAEFAGHAWLSTRPGSAGHQNFLQLCAAAGFDPAMRFQTDDYDVIRGFVRQRLGVALVPALALGTDRSIHMRRLTGPAPTRFVVLLWRSTDPNPLIAAATEALAEAAEEFVEWTATALHGADGPVATTPARRARERVAGLAEHQTS